MTDDPVAPVVVRVARPAVTLAPSSEHEIVLVELGSTLEIVFAPSRHRVTVGPRHGPHLDALDGFRFRANRLGLGELLFLRVDPERVPRRPEVFGRFRYHVVPDGSKVDPPT